MSYKINLTIEKLVPINIVKVETTDGTQIRLLVQMQQTHKPEDMRNTGVEIGPESHHYKQVSRDLVECIIDKNTVYEQCTNYYDGRPGKIGNVEPLADRIIRYSEYPGTIFGIEPREIIPAAIENSSKDNTIYINKFYMENRQVKFRNINIENNF